MTVQTGYHTTGGHTMLGHRFWSKVEMQSMEGCWEWHAAKNSEGYGRYYFDGKARPAHRLAYEAMRGPIPTGLQIDHLCRNRACVNLDHLEPVSGRVNVLRGEGPAARCARVTLCPQGHPYDEANTYITTKGKRNCRACTYLQHRENRRRKARSVQL